jgi:hypothetical protein
MNSAKLFNNLFSKIDINKNDQSSPINKQRFRAVRLQKIENQSPVHSPRQKPNQNLKAYTDFNSFVENAHLTKAKLKANFHSDENANLPAIEINQHSAIRYGLQKIDFSLTNNACDVLPMTEPKPIKRKQQTLNDFLFRIHFSTVGNKADCCAAKDAGNCHYKSNQSSYDHFLTVINASLNSDTYFYLHEAFYSNKHLIIEKNLNKYELYDLFVKFNDMKDVSAFGLFANFVDDHIRMNKPNLVLNEENKANEHNYWSQHLNMLNILIDKVDDIKIVHLNVFQCFFKLMNLYFVNIYSLYKLEKNVNLNGWEFMQKPDLKNEFCIDPKLHLKLFALFESLVIHCQNQYKL